MQCTTFYPQYDLIFTSCNLVACKLLDLYIHILSLVSHCVRSLHDSSSCGTGYPRKGLQPCVARRPCRGIVYVEATTMCAVSSGASLSIAQSEAVWHQKETVQIKLNDAIFDCIPEAYT